MHELSLGTAIVETVARHCGGRRVTAVFVNVGGFRQVSPRSLAFYFEFVARGTMCDAAGAGSGWRPEGRSLGTGLVVGRRSVRKRKCMTAEHDSRCMARTGTAARRTGSAARLSAPTLRRACSTSRIAYSLRNLPLASNAGAERM
jgi:hypothetical protein